MLWSSHGDALSDCDYSLVRLKQNNDTKYVTNTKQLPALGSYRVIPKVTSGLHMKTILKHEQRTNRCCKRKIRTLHCKNKITRAKLHSWFGTERRRRRRVALPYPLLLESSRRLCRYFVYLHVGLFTGLGLILYRDGLKFSWFGCESLATWSRFSKGSAKGEYNKHPTEG